MSKKISMLVMLFTLLLAPEAFIGCGRANPVQNQPTVQSAKNALVKIIVEPEQRAAAFNYEGQFAPFSVSIAVGGTVTWNNTDFKEHSVVSDDGLFNEVLKGGQAFNYTFTQPGTYKYHDTLYDGLNGIVYVQ